MSRLHIQSPDLWNFHTQITVHIGDINYGNHLANDAVLRLCHEARLRFLSSMNYSELNIEGTGLIMLNALVEYKNQAYYGDILEFSIAITDLSKTGFNLIYRINRVKDGKIIALVQTGMAFFDYNRQRISRTPDSFRQRLNQVK